MLAPGEVEQGHQLEKGDACGAACTAAPLRIAQQLAEYRHHLLAVARAHGGRQQVERSSVQGSHAYFGASFFWRAIFSTRSRRAVSRRATSSPSGVIR